MKNNKLPIWLFNVEDTFCLRSENIHFFKIYDTFSYNNSFKNLFEYCLKNDKKIVLTSLPEEIQSKFRLLNVIPNWDLKEELRLTEPMRRLEGFVGEICEHDEVELIDSIKRYSRCFFQTYDFDVYAEPKRGSHNMITVVRFSTSEIFYSVYFSFDDLYPLYIPGQEPVAKQIILSIKQPSQVCQKTFLSYCSKLYSQAILHFKDDGSFDDDQKPNKKLEVDRDSLKKVGFDEEVMTKSEKEHYFVAAGTPTCIWTMTDFERDSRAFNLSSKQLLALKKLKIESLEKKLESVEKTMGYEMIQLFKEELILDERQQLLDEKLERLDEEDQIFDEERELWMNQIQINIRELELELDGLEIKKKDITAKDYKEEFDEISLRIQEFKKELNFWEKDKKLGKKIREIDKKIREVDKKIIENEKKIDEEWKKSMGL